MELKGLDLQFKVDKADTKNGPAVHRGGGQILRDFGR